MIIYNTTYLVSDRMHSIWMKWLREEHIPAMLGSGIFTRPQVAKVLTADAQQEGTSYSVQFHAADTEMLNTWYSGQGDRFVNELTSRFRQEVLLFSSVLELVEW